MQLTLLAVRVPRMSLVRERRLALHATFFAALALVLACIGLYGVMTYRVARPTREIGIRIAVGASQHTVVWMMVRQTQLLVSLGAALGTLASLAANRYIAGELFGVRPRDPLAIVVALSVLGIVTMLAGYVPARQASRIVRSGRCGRSETSRTSVADHRHYSLSTSYRLTSVCWSAADVGTRSVDERLGSESTNASEETVPVTGAHACWQQQ